MPGYRADDRVRRDQAERVGSNAIVPADPGSVRLRLLAAGEVAPQRDRAERVVRGDRQHQRRGRERNAEIGAVP